MASELKTNEGKSCSAERSRLVSETSLKGLAIRNKTKTNTHQHWLATPKAHSQSDYIYMYFQTCRSPTIKYQF